MCSTSGRRSIGAQIGTRQRCRCRSAGHGRDAVDAYERDSLPAAAPSKMRAESPAPPPDAGQQAGRPPDRARARRWRDSLLAGGMKPATLVRL